MSWFRNAIGLVGLAGLLGVGGWVWSIDQHKRTSKEIHEELTKIVTEQEATRKARKTLKEYTRDLCEKGELEQRSERCVWARQPD